MYVKLEIWDKIPFALSEAIEFENYNVLKLELYFGWC